MPEIGKEFKPLSEVLESDPTNDGFHRLDRTAPGGHRRISLEERYRQLEQLALPTSVPDIIRGYFDAARMLWLYGWLYYPFYTWAGFHALLCVEMALKVRFAEETPQIDPRKRMTFESMTAAAVERGWIAPEGMSRLKRHFAPVDEIELERLSHESEFLAPKAPLSAEEGRALLKGYLALGRQLRNDAAHPEANSFGLPGDGYTSLEVARDIIRQLFPPAATQG